VNDRARTGSGLLIVVILIMLMALFFVTIGRLRSGAETLRSKSARDYVATTIAEAGLNCIIGELNYNRTYYTHWYYDGKQKDLVKGWKSPVKSRTSGIGEVGEIELDGVSAGIYTGRTPLGEFKLKCAPFRGSKGFRDTDTLEEQNIYVQYDVVARAGTDAKAENNSYRRITGLIERRFPTAEHILFDGEMLDTAYGPYIDKPNELRRGRVYGYQWIVLNTTGGVDRGSVLTEMEKVETPGMIRSIVPTEVTFVDKKKTTVDRTNDSMAFSKFKAWDGYLLDGAHGAHPIKLTHLQMERIENEASELKSGGLVVDEKTFPLSTWKNPYDKKTNYYEVDFGGYNVGVIASGTESSEAPAPKGCDDPGPLSKMRGRKYIIYSKVPLRIWGCPDRPVTICCEKDVVIAGDFNQNPATPQDYPDIYYQDYKTKLMNGKTSSGGDNHKVNALVMSRERVLIDTSRPTLFARNEVTTALRLAIGLALHPVNAEQEKLLRENFCPADGKPKSIIGEGIPDPNTGIPIPFFAAIAWLCQNAGADPFGPLAAPQMEDLIALFTPSGSDDGKPHFGIRDEAERKKLIVKIVEDCRDDGLIDPSEIRDVVDQAMLQAMKEEFEKPAADCGVMSMMAFLFDEAKKSPTDGLWPPEITINAMLVSSTRRASKWRVGMALPKVFDEIGNAPGGESDGIVQYLKKPRFLIQRVYGSEVRLASTEPRYFIDGKYTGDAVLRRRLWDTSLYSADYRTEEMPEAFNLLTYSESTIAKDVFDSF